MTKSKEVRTLPPDVYDALEFSSLVFGGIGAGRYVDSYNVPEEDRCPVCIHGHRWAICAEGVFSRNYDYLLDAFDKAEITEEANDAAVRAVNRRRARLADSRISFKQWAKELNVVRGSYE